MLAIVAVAVCFLLVIALLSDQGSEEEDEETSTRADAIPDDAVKGTVATDLYPPVLHSDEWETPVPMPGPVNTAGAEDSPFITPDGSTFFFFFTPDVDVPPEQQLLDGVTGIWWCRMENGSWTEPERILLCDDVALDGAEYVIGETMWFASVRVGNYGEIDYYTAELAGGEWGNVQNVGEQLNVDYDIGEMHLALDGDVMYFHSSLWSDEGDMDIYTTSRTVDGWSEPAEVPGINTDSMEGYPFITADGNELWYTGHSGLGYPGPALYRAVKNGSAWDPAEEVVSSFAGECTMDAEGNLYFVHHYFDEDMEMIEADIYVAYRASETRAASMSEQAENGAPGSDAASMLLDLLLRTED